MHGSVNFYLVNYQIVIDQSPIHGPIYTAHKAYMFCIYRYIEAPSNE